MKREEFVGYLEENKREFAWREKTLDGSSGVEVDNHYYGTKTFFAWPAVAGHGLEELLTATHQGRNTEHITRVTGYFSKVKSWNQGKVAELADRHRSPLD